MTAKKPVAPSALRPAGVALWRAVVAGYELERHELASLELACRQADLCTDLEALIAEDGLVVIGSSGQRRLNGAVSELRQSRLALAKLVSELSLPTEDALAAPSPATLRARKAARARWDEVQAREARQMRAVGG